MMRARPIVWYAAKAETTPSKKLLGGMDMIRRLVSALLLGVLLTSASYLIDSGCSCGPAHGLPFTFEHPYVSCSASSRFVIGANPEWDRFGPVFDLESVGYDIVFWSVAAYFVARHYRRKKTPQNGPPNPVPTVPPAVLVS